MEKKNEKEEKTSQLTCQLFFYELSQKWMCILSQFDLKKSFSDG